MAVDCTITSLTAASKCYNCLSTSEKMALKVFFLAQALKAAGGDDLTNANTLLSAAACFKCEPKFVLDSFDVAIHRELARVSGLTESFTIAQLRAQIKCLTCTDQQALLAAYILLLCKFTELT